MKVPPEAVQTLRQAMNCLDIGHYSHAASLVGSLKSRATPEFSGYILAIEVSIEHQHFTGARGLMAKALDIYLRQ